MNWYLKVLKQYTDFGGRARRKEYWMFVLCNLIISFMIGVLDVLLEETLHFPSFGDYGLLAIIYMLFIFLPSVAVIARRLHDTGRSGYWIFLSLIPLAGVIILIVFLCMPSQVGSNEWGPNPFEEELPDLDINKFDEL